MIYILHLEVKQFGMDTVALFGTNKRQYGLVQKWWGLVTES